MTATQRSDDGSHLFLVRVWLDAGTGTPADAPGEREEAAALVSERNGCHGRVQHVISGEAASFADWTTLAGAIRNMTGGSETSRNKSP